MSVMGRFIDEVELLLTKLRHAEHAYNAGLTDAAVVSSGGSRIGGRIVFMPDTGGPVIELAMDDAAREALLDRSVVAQVNENVERMEQLWRGVISQSEGALSVIAVASAKVSAVPEEIAPAPAPAPTQSIGKSIVPGVAAVIQPTVNTVPAAPTRVRRIVRED